MTPGRDGQPEDKGWAWGDRAVAGTAGRWENGGRRGETVGTATHSRAVRWRAQARGGRSSLRLGPTISERKREIRLGFWIFRPNYLPNFCTDQTKSKYYDNFCEGS